jgi:hypothetical protein
LQRYPDEPLRSGKIRDLEVPRWLARGEPRQRIEAKD